MFHKKILASIFFLFISVSLLPLGSLNALVITPSFNNRVVDAADRNNLQLLKQLLEEDATQVNAKGNFGATPLIRAAYRGNEAIVSYLIDQKADINLGDVGGETALHIASREGRLSVVRMLVKKGANLETQDTDGWTPLMRATLRGRARVTQFLIASGASVSAMNRWGESPVILSSKMGNVDIVKMLVAKDKDIERLNAAKQFALRYGHDEIVKVLDKNLNDATSSLNAKTVANASKQLQQKHPKPVYKSEHITTKIIGGTEHLQVVAKLDDKKTIQDGIITSTKLDQVAPSKISKIKNYFAEEDFKLPISDVKGKAPKTVSRTDRVLEVPRNMFGAVKGFGARLTQPIRNKLAGIDNNKNQQAVSKVVADNVKPKALEYEQDTPKKKFSFRNNNILRDQQAAHEMRSQDSNKSKADLGAAQIQDFSNGQLNVQNSYYEPIPIIPSDSYSPNQKDQLTDEMIAVGTSGVGTSDSFISVQQPSPVTGLENTKVIVAEKEETFEDVLARNTDPNLPWKKLVKQDQKDSDHFTKGVSNITNLFKKNAVEEIKPVESHIVTLDKPVYQLKLANVAKLKRAEKEGFELQHKFGKTLELYHFEILPTKLDRRYEVRTGVFKDVSEAKEACDELNSMDQYCTVVRTNKVSSLSMAAFLDASVPAGVVTLVSN